MNTVDEKEMRSIGERENYKDLSLSPGMGPSSIIIEAFLKGGILQKQVFKLCIHCNPYPKKNSPAWTRGSSSSLLLFLLLFLSWADSLDPDGGVSLLSVPPAAVYGNRDRELLPNREKSRRGLTLNWVGSTISISTRGAEKPALICGGNVNHFTIRAHKREKESCSFAFS